jgi:hypothetical protein
MRTQPRRARRALQTALLLGAAGLFTAVPALLLPASAFAQTGNSVVTGQVVDAASGAPVPDVVVTATSPALQGEQIVVTDASGSFRIPNLPPGDYTLRMDKETYQPYSRGGISVRVSTTIRVNTKLAPTSFKEEIVIVARAPTVDVGSSATGQNIGQDFLRRIAVAPPSSKGSAQRSFESVADVAPGAQSDAYGTSINGTTSPENQYVIDGLSVNDPAYGILGTPLSVEFIKEVNVISGGYMPEYGRSTGGVLEAVTKSGSNTLHGSVFASITPGALEAAPEKVKREGQTILTDHRLSALRDFGFELGGPIIKDKLWFFGGLQLAVETRLLDRSLNRFLFDPSTGSPLIDPETGFTRTEVLPGTERTFKAEQRTIQYIGKLTYQINQDNSISLSIYGSPQTSGGDGKYGINPKDGTVEVNNINGTFSRFAHKYVALSNDVALKWSTASKNKRLLFDATFGWHYQESAKLPSDGSSIGDEDTSVLAGVPSVQWRRSGPFHSIPEFESLPAEARKACAPQMIGGQAVLPCPVSTYNTGGPDLIDQGSLNRWQLKGVVTSLFSALGHHVVKGGVDLEIMRYDHVKAISGRVRYREDPSGFAFEDLMYGFLTGPDQHVTQPTSTAASLSTTIGGFIQDSWSVMDKVTLNLGARYDAQLLIGNDGKLAMALANQLSPRVGAVYDFTQQGRSKLFANYARYYESVPLDIVDRAFGNESQIASVHLSSVCDPRDPAVAAGNQPGQCQHDSTRYPYGPPFDPSPSWFQGGGPKVPIDPELSPQSSDEIVVGGEYEIIANGRVGLQYTRRWMNNIIEDMSLDGSVYFIGNPGKGMGAGFPEAVRDYDAATLYFQKAFADLWLAQASYTLSYLRGNYAGLYRPETGQLDPNFNTDFDLQPLTVNRTGPLPSDRTHDIKLYGAKAFAIPGGMAADVGLTYRTRSGSPTSYAGSHPIYGPNQVFILPRGAGERMPWVHTIDAHVGYAIDLAKDSQLMLSLDIFNVFNFQAAVAVDESYTFADVAPCEEGEGAAIESCLQYLDGSAFDPKDKNPNYGNPTRYQPPRAFRFGARVTF